MKKIFAIVLVVVMMMSMGSTAFAVDYIEGETKDYSDSTSIDVYAKYSADTKGVGVISVDIKYEEMRFIFVADGSAGKWNPDTHTYDSTNPVLTKWVAEGGETDGGHVITVINHSNVPVWVNVASAVDTDNYATITGMSFQNYDTATPATWKVEKLEAGQNAADNPKAVAEADNVRILANLEGTLDPSVDTYEDVADIIITIYGDDPENNETP